MVLDSRWPRVNRHVWNRTRQNDYRGWLLCRTAWGALLASHGVWFVRSFESPIATFWSRALLAAAILIPASFSMACIIPFNGPGDIRRDIESITGRDYDRSFGLTVGRD